MSTHLGESCDLIPHVWENRGLVAHLEVKVDGLVREGGKLITEAKLINALDLGPVREAVILLLGLPVDDVSQWVLHIAINIVVASSDDLTVTKSLPLLERPPTLTKCQPHTATSLYKHCCHLTFTTFQGRCHDTSHFAEPE
jgi:hypothetical protein